MTKVAKCTASVTRTDAWHAWHAILQLQRSHQRGEGKLKEHRRLALQTVMGVGAVADSEQAEVLFLIN